MGDAGESEGMGAVKSGGGREIVEENGGGEEYAGSCEDLALLVLLDDGLLRGGEDRGLLLLRLDPLLLEHLAVLLLPLAATAYTLSAISNIAKVLFRVLECGR
jgi:hypothetical protein